jgi:hypothetical protein
MSSKKKQTAAISDFRSCINQNLKSFNYSFNFLIRLFDFNKYVFFSLISKNLTSYFKSSNKATFLFGFFSFDWLPMTLIVSKE